MRNKISLLGTIAFVISGYASVAPAYEDWPCVSGPYLGQQPPGMTAEMFAPDIVSTDQSEVNSVFSPDGKYLFFSSKRAGKGDIFWVDAKVIEALNDEQ